MLILTPAMAGVAGVLPPALYMPSENTGLHGNLGTKSTHLLMCTASQLVDSSLIMNSIETPSAMNPGFLGMLFDFYSNYDSSFNACSLLC